MEVEAGSFHEEDVREDGGGAPSSRAGGIQTMSEDIPSEEELKAIIIDSAEAVISLEEKLVNVTYDNINKKRQILNMMRELPLETCIKYVKDIIPKEVLEEFKL
uniref:Uncharacterized protein n=2 Tax=viral metagenome TaxID=1070528 RepID=A0A6M3M1Z4_9ZZZZ